MIKRKMSVLLAAIVVASGVGMAQPAFAANANQKAMPVITYAAPDHTLATNQEPFSFALECAKYEGDVQYRVFVQKDGGKWFELTDGYSEAVNAKTPYIPKVTKKLAPGNYKASIWVKRAGVEGVDKNKFGACDTFNVQYFSIKAPEAFNGRAKLDNLGLKDTYKVGEKVTIKGEKDAKYKLHIYDPSASTREKGWMIDNTYETSDATTYTFTKPGKYMIDVWGMSTNPTQAVKNQGYGGWLLKVVTVEENKEEDVKVESIKIEAGLTAFDRYVELKLNVSDQENYKVTVCGKELKYVAAKGFFQGVVPQTEESEIKANVKIQKIGEKVEVPNFKVEEVSAGLTAFDRYVKVTLDTKTPEKFNVTVCGKELKFVDGKGFFQGVVAQTDENEIKSNVKVTVK